MIATTWEGAVDTAAAHADALTGKVVISMANGLEKVGSEFRRFRNNNFSTATGGLVVFPSLDSFLAGDRSHIPYSTLKDDASAVLLPASVKKLGAEALQAVPAGNSILGCCPALKLTIR